MLRGQVTASDGGHMLVAVTPQAVCASCAAGRGCGMGLLASKQSPRIIRVDCDPASVCVAVGEQVHLSCTERGVLHASMLAYGLPLLGLLFGASIAPISAAAWLAVPISASGLIVGFVLARWLTRRQAVAQRFKLTVSPS